MYVGRGIWEADPKSGRTAIHPHENTNKTVWLFNITNDPTESLDLSMKYPEMVKTLLDMLQTFNNTAVPCRFPASDPRSNPSKHGDYWGPWL